MKNTTRHFFVGTVSMAALALIFLLPLYASAAGLVPCGDTPDDPCTFDHIIILINTLMSFLLVDVAVPLAALTFMWLGVQIMLHPNESEALSQIKESLWSVFIGFFWIVAGFLVVKAILFAFVDPSKVGGKINFLLGF